MLVIDINNVLQNGYCHLKNLRKLGLRLKLLLRTKNIINFFNSILQSTATLH